MNNFTVFVPYDWKRVDVWTEEDPNLLGEALRLWSFKGSNGERGCYETFEVNDCLIELKEGKYYNRAKEILCPEFDSMKVYSFEHPEIKDNYFHIKPYTIIVGWYWDGDGTLYFRIINEEKDVEILNSDCKKDYYWEQINE